MRGLYVHIPFCAHKCDYCDFYSVAGRLECLDKYLEALFKEAAAYGRRQFNTLFVGGGTPSLLGSAGVYKLLSGLSAVFQLSRLQESTLEANPESITEELLATAGECGINRISIGIQSLCDVELQKVGRIHNAAQAVQALEKTRREGFTNISADVILGLPGQTEESLKITLETLCGLEPAHISVYCLALEPQTPLARHPPADLPSDDEQADLYARTVDLLEQRGYRRYEISNFALPGFECRHNLNYWQAGDYIGLGPAAASHERGCRYRNKPDLEAYLADPCGQKEDYEKLSRKEKAVEEAILRLRLLKDGLDLKRLIQKYGDQNVVGLAARLNCLSKQGHISRENNIYRLNPSEALVSNSILSELTGD